MVLLAKSTLTQRVREMVPQETVERAAKAIASQIRESGNGNIIFIGRKRPWYRRFMRGNAKRFTVAGMLIGGFILFRSFFGQRPAD